MKILEAWRRAPRYLDVRGGTRSGKTYAILLLLILHAWKEGRRVLVSVVSENLPHLKRGAIRDFRDILERHHAWEDGRWSRVEHIYKFPSGSIIEFFGADDVGKVHGAARDFLFINEAQNIDYEVARQLFVRTRKAILIDYNPICSFWATEKIATREDCITVTSTYRDNQFLSAAQVREIEYNRGDPMWWRVYGEGLIGEMKGLFFRKISENIGTADASIKDVYLGIDWAVGSGGDYSVITAVNTRGQMIGQWRVNEMPPTEQVAWMAEVIRGLLRDGYRILRIIAERNSLGAVYCSMLRKAIPQGVALQEFTTTNESKREVVEWLQAGLDSGQVTLLDNATLLAEMQQFQCVVNPRTRVLTFGGAGGAHDDCVMSLAFAYYGYRKSLGDIRLTLV